MARNWGDDDDKKDGLGQRRWDVPGTSAPAQSNSDKLDELIQRAEPMIEQVTNLYQQFVSGVERLPPNEKRKQLETLMAQIQNTPKPNATYRFRATTLNNHFITMRDRWERLMRDIESGKIKRSVGPGRKS